VGLYFSFQILRDETNESQLTLSTSIPPKKREPIGHISLESSGTNCTGWHAGRGAHVGYAHEETE